MHIAPTIKIAIANSLKGLGLFVREEDVVLEHTETFEHGDYATSAALAYAKQFKTSHASSPAGEVRDPASAPSASGLATEPRSVSPRALAEKLVASLGTIEGVSKIEIAGPGFINFTLDPRALYDVLEKARTNEKEWGKNTSLEGKAVMVEYAQPNPFKSFHIGHLMNITIGEALTRLVEFSGAKVIRANYQGDVGVHIACAIWGIKKLGIHPTSADEFGRAYTEGAAAYKENADAKAEIDTLNKKIYGRTDSDLNELYDTGRTESLAAFEKIYATLGTKFDHYFFESETAPKGKDIVLAHPDVFPLSDGARVFKGEEYGLHTRVFLNSQGLPTYEGKELGLEKLKTELFPDAQYLYVVAANEIIEYFRVLKKAMELIFPDVAAKLHHVSYGMMRFAEGKMSSRTGNVITGESLLNDLTEAAKERSTDSRAENVGALAQQVAVAAIKFQVLKGGISKDIIFDRERALSLEGDSGPYLQYAHARTSAIMEKAKEAGVTPALDTNISSDIARLIYRFPEVVVRAQEELEPHHVASYLIALASSFNSWYAQEHILDGTPQAAHKVALTDAVRITLKNGLWLLGIPAPERM